MAGTSASAVPAAPCGRRYDPGIKLSPQPPVEESEPFVEVLQQPDIAFDGERGGEEALSIGMKAEAAIGESAIEWPELERGRGGPEIGDCAFEGRSGIDAHERKVAVRR